MFGTIARMKLKPGAYEKMQASMKEREAQDVKGFLFNTVYRSKTDLRLLLVDKENGGKADALNCGSNFARYRYLCCVDGDSVYKRDALLTNAIGI